MVNRPARDAKVVSKAALRKRASRLMKRIYNWEEDDPPEWDDVSEWVAKNVWLAHQLREWGMPFPWHTAPSGMAASLLRWTVADPANETTFWQSRLKR